MPAPTIRQVVGAVGSGNVTVTTTTATAVGDLLVAVHQTAFRAASDLVSPSGTTGTWAQIVTAEATGTGTVRMRAWRRYVTAAGAQTVTMAPPGAANTNSVIVYVISGAHQSAPIDGTPSTAIGTSGTTQSVPATSPTSADARLIGSWGGYGGGVGTAGFTPPSGMSDTGTAGRENILSGSTNNAHMASSVGLSAAGSTGAKAATTAAAPTSWAAVLFAVAGLSSPVEVSAGPGYIAAQGATVAASHRVAAPAANVVVQGASIAATIVPVVRVSAGAGDIRIEGAPVTITRRLPALPCPAIAVETPALNLARRVAVGIVDIAVTGTPASALGTAVAITRIIVQGPPIQVSYGATGVGGQAGIVAIPAAPTTRFIVQSVLTGQILSWDLPIVDPTVSLALSGPTSITGELRPEDPEVRDLLGAGLEPWACWIHVETDGFVRASGILQPYQIDDEMFSIEATGPSSYLSGIPYLGEYSAIGVDPADVVREIWRHVQSYPDGRLGVTVYGSTPMRIGEPEPEEGVDYEEGERPAGPYRLSWWEGTDCGSEVNKLAQEAAFDYVERCRWNSTRTAVDHWIDIGYPRLGRRRDDLRFAFGENIVGAIPAEETDDLYASQVLLFGKGEGRDTISGYAGRPLRKRLRRVAVIQDSTVETVTRANALAGADLERRQGLVDVTDLEIEARHPNAEFGSYSVGDDILIDVEVAWLGRLRQYERILSITYSPDGEVVRLQLRRAEAFRYGGLT